MGIHEVIPIVFIVARHGDLQQRNQPVYQQKSSIVILQLRIRGRGWWKKVSCVNLRQAIVRSLDASTYCAAMATSDAKFCAGYDTSDLYQGDNSGPLMTVATNLGTCTGIASFSLSIIC